MGGQETGRMHRGMPCIHTLMRTRRACMSRRLLAGVQQGVPVRAWMEGLNPRRQAAMRSTRCSEAVAVVQLRPNVEGAAQSLSRQMLTAWACWLGMSPAVRAAGDTLVVVDWHRVTGKSDSERDTHEIFDATLSQVQSGLCSPDEEAQTKLVAKAQAWTTQFRHAIAFMPLQALHLCQALLGCFSKPIPAPETAMFLVLVFSNKLHHRKTLCLKSA